MAMFSHRGRRLHYESLGEGKPVVLIHGFSNFGLSWMQQLPLLVNNGYQAIVPDLYGHGLSDPASQVTSVDDLADDILALLDHLGVGPAVLCGLSLGGMVAQQFALAHPERTTALVIANSRATFAEPRLKEVVAGWIAMFEQPQGARKRFEATWPILVNDAFRESPTGVAAFDMWAALADRTEGVSLANVARGMTSFDVRGQLGAIAVPTLVISGERDALFPPAQSAEISQSIPGAQFVTIPGAAHLSCLDSAADFNRLLLSLLSELR
ncbi:MAG: 3-oxoadipate enol-lactonase [Caballeronia sp.]|jgi:3-oxoadipate enol-lactonase|nr:3-oxoadipate enol-lactonase [Caballeronia sp.]